jgi:hypothetical protein
VRSVGLDVHFDFGEVAIIEDGEMRFAGRVETSPERLEIFAGSLVADDRVALEVTENAWEIARMLEPHVAQVLVVSPSDTAIRQARAKTDRLDARTPCEVVGGGVVGRGLDAGRGDLDDAPAALAPQSAGVVAHAREEPGRCGPDASARRPAAV